MSLDVYLTHDREPTQRERAVQLLKANGFEDDAIVLECQSDPDNPGYAYSSNITHNLAGMAREAGIYEACWRPEEIGITHAKQLIEPLRDGLRKLQGNRTHFEQFNAPNGWGLYEHFVPWVSQYLSACEENPEAKVWVSR